MKVTIIKRADNRYSYKGVPITMNTIGNMVREGYEITVKDTQEYDWTKETLVAVAFKNHISNRTPQYEDLINALSHLLTDDKIIYILENGGLDEYMRRLARRNLI